MTHLATAPLGRNHVYQFTKTMIFAYWASKLISHFVVVIVRRKATRTETLKVVPFTISRLIKLYIHIKQNAVY